MALVKGSEMNMMAELGDRGLEQKTEIQIYKLEINGRNYERNIFNTKQG